MSPQPIERVAYGVSLALLAIAAVGTLVADGEVEIALLMVSAVIAGLLCFDTSMDRNNHSFWPWFLVSLAPIAKTAPSVLAEVRADSSASPEQYGHIGTLLFGCLIAAAMWRLAQAAESLGRFQRRFDIAVLLGAALTAGLAGTSVAFLYDRDLGSLTTARLIETPTWFIIGLLLASTALAASYIHTFTPAVTGVLVTSALTVVALAYSVAGRDFDRGWWSVLFAGFALSATGLGSAGLGVRSRRDRRSTVGVTISLVVGVIGAAAAIAARSDRTYWSPGWALLGVLSLAMFGLAMASRPIDESGQDPRATERAPDTDIGTGGGRAQVLERSQRSAQAKDTALKTLRDAADPSPASLRAGGALAATTAAVPAARASAGSEPVVAIPTEIVPAPTPSVPEPELAREPQPAAAHATSAPERTDRASYLRAAPAPNETSGELRWADSAPDAHRPAAARGLSNAGTLASARAATDARAPHSHQLAPLAQAHYFDPSTGLLSAPGLQQALARAFAEPKAAGQVTIMMFTVRDIDRIEATSGRLASAAVTSELADRVRAALPDGIGARFARSAFAVLFDHDLGESNAAIQRLARVLVQLREPVEGATNGAEVDVVAGMAQCYTNEQATSFVLRANQGLERAVKTPEPTFVAMP